MNKYTNIDEYLEDFTEDIQLKLQKIRNVVKKYAPNAKEKISYGIPTFYLNGNLVHFAGFKDHISFFPTSSGVANFQDELKNYKTSKGTIQFPLDKPIPYKLIVDIVKFRVKENSK